jgi:hypothetical protein
VSLLHRWFNAFLVTLLIETPIVARMLRGRTEPRTAVELALLATSLTHPFLWFAWRPVVDDYTTYVVSGEALVFLAETCVYRKVTSWRYAALVSLVANGASWGLGWLLLYGGSAT